MTKSEAIAKLIKFAENRAIQLERDAKCFRMLNDSLNEETCEALASEFRSIIEAARKDH